MSKVTDHGLPHSVDSIDKLPKHAYDGHLCYVTSDDGGLYLYNGTEYVAVSGSSGGGHSKATVPVYETVTTFPDDAKTGELAFASSTKAVYFYNGSAWKKLGEASA